MTKNVLLLYLKGLGNGNEIAWNRMEQLGYSSDSDSGESDEASFEIQKEPSRTDNGKIEEGVSERVQNNWSINSQSSSHTDKLKSLFEEENKLTDGDDIEEEAKVETNHNQESTSVESKKEIDIATAECASGDRFKFTETIRDPSRIRKMKYYSSRGKGLQDVIRWNLNHENNIANQHELQREQQKQRRNRKRY
ncbi:hypothetical protein DAMA08_021930 [Martiniozyma asiatica (nom. inval.)]|nr:hypothetical protein DAMA08_021930 [Martiniozyma asiatica]